jgi:hypothetical protein
LSLRDIQRSSPGISTAGIILCPAMSNFITYMCIYRILAKNKSGYVILCNECNHYQLAFGTTAVSFVKDDFRNFCDYILALNDSEASNSLNDKKLIKVDLSRESVMMILKHNELRSLYEIVCEAKFNIEMDDLLIGIKVHTE